VGTVAPVVQAQVSVSVPGESTNTTLTGVTPNFFKVQQAPVSEGQIITQAQQDNYATDVLLGPDVATSLFNRTTNLVGQKVRIEGQIFTVAGVLQSQGGNGFNRTDNRVLVPLSTAQVRLLLPNQASTPGEVNLIYVQAKNAQDVTAATDQVSQILRARHYLNLGVDDFTVSSTQAFLNTLNQVTGTLTLFLGGVAGVSLLVGGIGIMNIMLVTVTERTREIGLRKAIGARKRDIRLQFLVESALLSLGGGFIGILVGWGISSLVGRLAASSGTALNPIIQVNAVLLAVLFSAAVGLFFGIYPANRAAGLEPVEALRTE
jgi:putative ABC transport system permease protein